jgi:hypothetical protein
MISICPDAVEAESMVGFAKIWNEKRSNETKESEKNKKKDGNVDH